MREDRMISVDKNSLLYEYALSPQVGDLITSIVNLRINHPLPAIGLIYEALCEGDPFVETYFTVLWIDTGSSAAWTTDQAESTLDAYYVRLGRSEMLTCK